MRLIIREKTRGLVADIVSDCVPLVGDWFNYPERNTEDGTDGKFLCEVRSVTWVLRADRRGFDHVELEVEIGDWVEDEPPS